MRCSIVAALTLGLLLPGLPAFSGDRTLGVSGRDGQPGRSGRSGNNGTDQTIFYNGSPANLDLSGQAGEDGEDGRDAERAQCDRGGWSDRSDRSHDNRSTYSRSEYDLQGANGGDGGRGGSGGSGGNGGNLVLYYQDGQNLRNLLVRSVPGTAGRSGRGGYASYGCQCPQPHWEVKKCTGKDKDQKCTVHHYRCTDGRNGRNGENGRDGNAGISGKVTLIKRSTILPEEVIQVNTTLGQLSQQPVSVSRNFWSTQSGAASLFASGSQLQDAYPELSDRVERSVELQWRTNYPLAKVAQLPVKVELERNKDLTIALSSDLWSKQSRRRAGNTELLTIDQAIARQDALNLSPVGLYGVGSKLAVKLTDLSKQSNQVKTEGMRLNYRVRDNELNYISQFESVIPATAIETRGEEFRVAIGQLPIPANLKQAGTVIEMELTVTRSFGVDRGDQVITYRGIVGELPKR
jgi:hypothetical protein